jgi:integrator complex subunit 4
MACPSFATPKACGAFVHGLEDEFYEVREASIKAICKLCLCSVPLATKALDFLADMFNDEIDSVIPFLLSCS